MNRRSFFKVVGGLSAAIALPVDGIAAILPAQWGISPVRWTRAFDAYHARWVFRADVFVGKNVKETPTKITIENQHQLCVDMMSYTEELSEADKKVALEVLMNHARQTLASTT